jgi:hypothetical protein
MNEPFPLNMTGSCVAGDDELFANIALALQRGLPELNEKQPVQANPSIAIVASGPSLAGQLDKIREMKAAGIQILAVRGGHDYLIANGIIPNFALTVDPLADSWHCFERKHKDVTYLIASQCNAAVFDHLADQNVVLWHAYMKKDQDRPKNRMLIGGSTTSGLRAIFVAWIMGYRDFHLFGLDSCLATGRLRVDGSGLKAGDKAFPVQIEPHGEVFLCNPNMALQAQSFQDCYSLLEDARFTGYGHGLIQAIIAKRAVDSERFDAARRRPHAENGRVSFIHAGGEGWASYRYRGLLLCDELGATMNDYDASTLIFIKPQGPELLALAEAKHRGQRVIVDFCDDHFDWVFYQEFLRLADLVTCPTPTMAERIKNVPFHGREAVVIPDPYEFPQEKPHCGGWNCLWFGNAVNQPSLLRIWDDIKDYPVRVVGNFENAIPWSHATMLREFKDADVVLMPATEDYKSANRTVEAIRQGCFVIAEPHPAINGFPGIWIGNIKEGLEWLKKQSVLGIQSRISLAQHYVTEEFTPKTVAAMWRNAIESLTTSEADAPTGQDGSTSMLEMAQT